MGAARTMPMGWSRGDAVMARGGRQEDVMDSTEDWSNAEARQLIAEVHESEREMADSDEQDEDEGGSEQGPASGSLPASPQAQQEPESTGASSSTADE